MEKGYHSTFFTPINILMKVSGVWSFFNEDKSTRALHFLYTLFWIFFLEFYCNLVETDNVKYVYHRLDLLIGHLGVLVTHYIGSIKVAIVFLNRKKLAKLMKELENNRFNYNFLGDFNPREIAENNKSTAKKTMLFFLGISTFVSLSRYIPSMFMVWSMEEKNLTCREVLPFLLTPPFPTNSMFMCLAGINFQNVIIVMYAWQIITCESLYVSCLTCLKSHLSILKYAFQSIRPRCLNTLNLNQDCDNLESRELEGLMNYEMKKSSIHLQNIIKNIEIMEEIYNKIILMQVLSVVSLIVSCLYTMSTASMFSSTFAAQMIYLIALSTQVTIYCWFGNEITAAAADVPTSIYSGDWISASPGFKRSMLINMLRMNRDIHLTIGKFSPLTVSTLVTIFRGSYSYFAVLKQVEN